MTAKTDEWTVEKLQQELLNVEKRGNFKYETLIPLWEKAKETIENEEQAVSLYTTFIYLTRRHIQSQGSQDYAKVDELFKEAIGFIGECFGEDEEGGTEASAKFQKNYAYFLYTKMRTPKPARQIWTKLLEFESGPFAWQEAISLERAYGDIEHARQLFYKALEAVTFRPHDIFAAFVQFEREEGTRDHLDLALECINAKAAEFNALAEYFMDQQQKIEANNESEEGQLQKIKIEMDDDREEEAEEVKMEKNYADGEAVGGRKKRGRKRTVFPSNSPQKRARMEFDGGAEGREEGKPRNVGKPFNPTANRPRMNYHDVQCFIDENAFERWIQGTDWTRESNRGIRSRNYICKFKHRKGYSCRARMRVIRPAYSTLIRVEQNEYEHTHEPVVPLEGPLKLTVPAKNFIDEQLMLGKTAQQIRNEFEYIYWDRLDDVPSLLQIQNRIQRQRKKMSMSTHPPTATEFEETVVPIKLEEKEMDEYDPFLIPHVSGYLPQ